MNTLQLAKIKQHLLQEIGDASKAPYSPIDTITDTEQDRTYRFTTDSGTTYQVDVITFYRGPNKPITARVAFGTLLDQYGDTDYDTQTNSNDIYRVMSTIVSIVKQDLRSHYADRIEFHPNKREGKDSPTDPLSNARAQLYLRYIKSQFRDAQITETPDGDIQVTLPNHNPNP